jgi:hypothetical protein
MLHCFVHIPSLAYLFKLDKLILVPLQIGRILGFDLLAIIKLHILSLGPLQVKPAQRSLTQPRLTVSSGFGCGVLEREWECVAHPFSLRDRGFLERCGGYECFLGRLSYNFRGSRFVLGLRVALRKH